MEKAFANKMRWIMKKVEMYKIVTVSMIIAINIIIQIMTVYSAKPRCVISECNKIRVKNEFYCKNHMHYEDLEITVLVAEASEQ